MAKTWLRARWQDAANRACLGSRDTAGTFDTLAQAYEEPNRHYHTLAHIADFLRLALARSEAIEHAGGDPAAFELAVFFHDAVYDIAAKDNEEASARLARQMLAPLAASDRLLTQIDRYVMATRHLSPSTGIAATHELLFADLDLAILASAPLEYRRYAAAVRREYAIYPDEAYRRGRAEVLRRFLAQPAIYRSRDHETVEANWEETARRNIAEELTALQNDVIWH